MFLFGEDIGEVKHLAVRQAEQTGKTFVLGEVDGGVCSPEFDEFTVVIDIPEEEFGAILSMLLYDRQMTPDHPDRVINQGRRAGPQGVVQRGLVQDRDDAVKLVLVVYILTPFSANPTRVAGPCFFLSKGLQ